MASEYYKKKEKTAIEVQEEYDLAIRRLREAQAKYNPDEFFHHKRKTNADRIRAMSDEELAELVGRNSLCEHLQEISWCKKRSVCTACIIDWLKSPVEK